MYDIQIKSDFQAGATLIVKIPEKELDQKALYTILTDKPDFILPFRHRMIDGQVEFTYQIGNRVKLAYLSGDRSPIEYANLWFSILRPLLDCDDWFMTPYSFVLKAEYLYYDKLDNTVSFIYIPSMRAGSDYDDLRNMVTEIAKQNRVTDIQLENKVVWAIQDFNLNEFLQMLKPHQVQAASEAIPQPRIPSTSEAIQRPVAQSSIKHDQSVILSSVKQSDIESKMNPIEKTVAAAKKIEDISINFQNDKSVGKEAKAKSGLFSRKKEKEAKSIPESREKRTLWGKKKDSAKEIIQGAAAMNEVLFEAQQPTSSSYAPINAITDDDATQLDMLELSGTKLRYVGNGDHPRAIEINIGAGSVFTIGRFDASLGTKQSSFEFDKKTKAVSRRHAVIERSTNGYNIVDLASAAGTFLNGQKLSPNVPFALERGYRVSFGHSGADYVWEE